MWDPSSLTGVKPVPLTVETQSPNQWAIRESQISCLDFNLPKLNSLS